MNYVFDWKEYASIARNVAAQGCVLLRNEEQALPIRGQERVSVFGRTQFDYYKSGTGSGGMVNAPYVVSIMEALQKEESISVNQKLLGVYEEWVKEHPFDYGEGWAAQPWCQEEMEVTAQLAKKAAENSDLALIIIGRTAGEDQDNSATKGSYYLTDSEDNMIRQVCEAFDRVAVILNVGNIIDMSFVKKYQPQAVLYVWQGGMEGGNAAVDVLRGRVNPSGKLTDTIAASIEDYPSTKDFGDEIRNYYREDIYVGYRYFETAAQDKVLYPFGFGLSYTTFQITETAFFNQKGHIMVEAVVQNTGNTDGKEVVEVYYNPPQTELCKPTRNLIRFAKTKLLSPGEEQRLTISFDADEMASFDDSGVTGYTDCFVLEKGSYVIFAGTDVRSAAPVGSVEIENSHATETLSEACAPVIPFKRKTYRQQGEQFVCEMEDTPLRRESLKDKISKHRPADRTRTEGREISFRQYYEGKATVSEYVDQLSEEDLICMTRGEGMCSAKVTAGIAGSYGGVTQSLKKYGMPIAGCSDGPSGIRMDCGTKAFALPNGTLLACTFDTALVEELYHMEGKELRKNKIDSLLGPGINIHRNPLNGRNFEYFSEDPYLTGTMAAAILKGLHAYGVTGTIKHFACNNQEVKRHSADSVVSKRALREIYLKGFEIAVKEGKAYNVMTTYGPLNGIWTAGNYELNTTILRDEWGFEGIVMTDWWAKINEENEEASIMNTAVMIRAQNDVYMVTADAASNANEDNSMMALEKGTLTRGELLRCAENICRALKKSLVSHLLFEGEDQITEKNCPYSEEAKKNKMPVSVVEGQAVLDITGLMTTAGSDNQYALHIPEKGNYNLIFKMKSDSGELAQMSMSISSNNMLINTITIHGTDGQWIERSAQLEVFVSVDLYVDLYFAQSGIEIGEIRVEKIFS